MYFFFSVIHTTYFRLPFLYEYSVHYLTSHLALLLTSLHVKNSRNSILIKSFLRETVDECSDVAIWSVLIMRTRCRPFPVRLPWHQEQHDYRTQSSHHDILLFLVQPRSYIRVFPTTLHSHKGKPLDDIYVFPMSSFCSCLCLMRFFQESKVRLGYYIWSIIANTFFVKCSRS